MRQQPYLMFRNTELGPAYGRLTLVSLAQPDGPRYPTDIPCERVYWNAGSGMCLQAFPDVLTTFKAVSFDHDFHITHTFELAGGPSRTRVSREGRFASSTVFVAGHGYASIGFSTRTTLYDLMAGTTLGDLETFSVLKDGQPFKVADFNFWGVTFASGGDKFFATLATGGHYYLSEGSVSGRQLRVLRDGVECPSLSPDETRVAFKSRQSAAGRIVWQLHVLDLKSGAETVVSESHSVDDQAEWLDVDHLLYALPRNVEGSGSSDIWMARADGTGAPKLLVSDALSPCVVRP